MVWSLAIDPADPRVIFAGTGTPSKAGIYRTPDAGQHLGAPARGHCRRVPERRQSLGPRASPSTRPTTATCGSGSRSTASGTAPTAARPGRRINGQIPNPDVHNVLVVAGPPKTVFTVVNDDVWRSTDDGATWQPARAREVFPWHYPREYRRQAGRSGGRSS